MQIHLPTENGPLRDREHAISWITKNFNQKLLHSEVEILFTSYNPLSTFHYEAYERLKEDEIILYKVGIKFYENDKYEYYIAEPRIGNYAIEIKEHTGEHHMICEFMSEIEDKIVLQVDLGKKNYQLTDFILNLAWHHTFTTYGTLHMEDLIRGLTLVKSGKKSFAGKVGAAISKKEIVKVSNKTYRFIEWKRNSMKNINWPKSAIHKMKLRAKAINVSGNEYKEL